MRFVRAHGGQVAFMVALGILGLLVGLFIFANQNVTPPSWAPVVGKDHYRLDARFESANGVMPGQGQAVTIAGVDVGKVESVRLDRGQAVVRLRLEEKYGSRVHPDATVLLRPKTPLKDMVVELEPGTKDSGPALKDGSTIDVDRTAPDVNFDEIIAKLDVDTRAQLAALLGDAGTAIGGPGGRALARALRRFEPLSRQGARATALLAQRGRLTRRLVTNIGRITKELGSSDAQLANFVKGTDAVFARFARQNRNLGETVRELPGTLRASTTGLQKAGRLSATLASGLPRVRPATRGLAPALRELQPLFAETRPVLEKQLRPFARDAQPVARRLAPGARLAAAAAPDLRTTTSVLNELFDAAAYDPPGTGVGQQSYLFYLPWAGHNTNSALSTQDAVGPIRRTILLFNCGTQQLLDNYTNPAARSDSPYLKTVIDLLNPPLKADNCPKGTGTK
jgi:phospholipid/cholesterol/gamma-HCH transport system substrate-binding protein